jgi:ABC-type phosphate transport system substrate-binding protein
MKRMMMLAVAAMAVLAAKAEAQGFQVIAHPGVSAEEIPAAELSKVFLKKSGKLPGGEPAKPVDLPSASKVRDAFSKAVHGRGASQIESYWQQQIFAGKDVPPDTKASDAEVVAYVSATPGAIGYVSAGAATSGVKVVKVGG